MAFISDLRGAPGGEDERGAHAARRAAIASVFHDMRQGQKQARLRRIDRWFPHRQILIRGPGRVSALHVGQRLQIAMLVTLGLGACALVGTMAYAGWKRHAAEEMAREVDDLRSSARLEAERSAADRVLLRRINDELSRRMAERDRATAKSQGLAAVQADIDRLLAEREATIERALAERARVAAERDQAIAERDAALSANRDLLDRLDVQTRSTIAEVEKIISSTGLDPNHLAPLKLPANEDRAAPRGGPLIPWTAGAHGTTGAAAGAATGGAPGPGPRQVAVTAGLDRLVHLRDVLGRLPLASPVGAVEMSSPFGYRIDPFTGRASLHEGIDLRGPRGTPVYATAPGLVTIAGWQSDFGRMVEIDHGIGMVTRYAHLDRVLVAPGDTVVLHQLIGAMGASGRATGVHLHYETRVDGHARNPINFLKADHYVPEKAPAPLQPPGELDGQLDGG